MLVVFFSAQQKEMTKSRLRLRPAPPKKVLKQNGAVSHDALRRQLVRVNALAGNWQSRLLPYERKPQKTIRTASDCSGYGSDLIAYKLLGLQGRVRPVQMSENDSVKVVLHEAVAKACGWHAQPATTGDMFLRKPEDSKASDVYVAGFPCPSFSRLGKGKGINDQRGFLTLKGMEHIALTRPQVIVLEQVASILQKKHEKVWNFVLKTLKSLNYDYIYKVMNTRDHAVPQSRPRVYLLAAVQEVGQGTLTLPEKRTVPVDLHHFLKKDQVGTEILRLPKYEHMLGPLTWQKGFVLDVGASPGWQHVVRNAAPCLIRTRMAQQGYYISKLKRRLLPEEAAVLQGVPAPVFSAMTAAAKENNIPLSAVAGSLGDAMSVNVLASVLMRGLTHAGLAKFGPSQDYWRLAENGPSAAQLSDNLFLRGRL